MRVGVYTRLSRDPDGTQTATARQERDCRDLADREGWAVVRVYEDADLSGYNPQTIRPDYQAMVDDLTHRRIDAVLVWKLDRLSRQPGQFEQIVSTCDQVGARIISVHEGADMTSPAGLAMLRVGMAFAAMESQTMSLRIRRAKADTADAGLPNAGGIRAFGHTADRRGLVEHEAVLVRELVDRFLAGESFSRVARDWSDRGIVTPKGNSWQVTSLKKMLASPRLTGARVHQGRVIPSDVTPAIIDEQTHARVLAALRPMAGRAPSGRSRALSGLVHCGVCGCKMHVRRRHRSAKGMPGVPIYRCHSTPGGPGCGRTNISAAGLEAIVGELLSVVLDTPDLADHLDGRDGDGGVLARELVELRRRREELVHDHYVTRLVSRTDFLPALAGLDRDISGVEDRLHRLRRRDILDGLDAGETVEAAWATRPALWCRALAESQIARVVVAPTARLGLNRVDPDRVSVEWRE